MLDHGSHAVAGLLPREVRASATAAELAEELAQAAARGLGVVPWGGGTQTGLGNCLSRFDLALETSKLNRLIEHSPADLTATVEAGMTLAALQAALAPYRQQVAIDAPLPHRATIGGVLATASVGPRFFNYGHARDQVIGIKVAHPDGKVTKAGGKVVKNVAGYDVTKLYIGSLGTLGVIVEATFRLAPLPATVSTVIVGCQSLEQVASLAHRVREARLQPLAVDALDTEAARRLHGISELGGVKGPWLLAIELGGGTAVLERQVRDVQATATSARCPVVAIEAEGSYRFWSTIRDFGRDRDSSSLIVKSTVLPSHLPELGLAIARAAGETGVPSPALVVRAGNGILYAFWSAADTDQAEPASWASVVETMRAVSVQAGGSTVVEECPQQLRPSIDVWGAAPETLSIMRRLKELFDPHCILNPGRYVGGL